ESEHVRLQANTWLAGIEGITPITKTETTSTHRHLHAGLVIVRGASAADPVPDDDARMIGGHAHQSQKAKPFMRIGQSVPHPSMGNATIETPDRPVKRGKAGARGEGEK